MTDTRNEEPRDPEELAQELQDLRSEFHAELSDELTRTRKPHSPYNLSLSRVKDLIALAAEIIEIIDQKTTGGREARFVANVVKGAVDHWQSVDAT